MKYPPLTPGRLIRRYKRFLADVELVGGEVVMAHCPNTGSMRSVDVPGCRVWLSPSTNPARKLGWTWELIELPQPDGSMAFASVNTGRTNAIVEEALAAQRIPELSGHASLRREVPVDGGRLDFRLDDASQGAAFVEVKQVTLKEIDGHGYFPASVTVRGARHLETLGELVAAGQRALLLFCVTHGGIHDVAPAAHIDPRYAETLRRVVERGVEVLAYGCEIEVAAGEPRDIRLGRPLPVSLRRKLALPM
ncbi:sugar fermentation stimulation protein A [Modicisalibacter ilicicola DSM 19980]|uniref:Sugar fermentation stimulation protein homolog n=1 Tax=Modicisalibacter ilicicola DSM 19980 TaxID=1121942 RepID=A0A1M5AMF0_9GAMM|nr:DNA/RNA nuclease SfsA [Halomonas ilicicola]SHF31448.1 sugar fermentation stimulation protein A [Halomonas ilicicola DSM 19980]